MQWIYLIPALPFLGALLLVLTSRRISKTGVALIGCGSVGLAALVTIIAGLQFMQEGSTGYTQHLWDWVNIGTFRIGMDLRLDALSLAFTFVITFVGFLIH